MAVEAAHNHVSVRVNDQREIGTTAGGQALKNARLIARSPRVHDLERRSAIASPDLSGCRAVVAW